MPEQLIGSLHPGARLPGASAFPHGSVGMWLGQVVPTRNRLRPSCSARIGCFYYLSLTYARYVLCPTLCSCTAHFEVR